MHAFVPQTYFPSIPPPHMQTYPISTRNSCFQKNRTPFVSCHARKSDSPPTNSKQNNDRPPSTSSLHVNISSSNAAAQTASSSGNVFFMAIADEFSVTSLYRRLLCSKQQFKGISVSATGSILHLSHTPATSNSTADAFVFPYGCMVVWGSQDDADYFVAAVEDDGLGIRDIPAIDTMNFIFGDVPSLNKDVITLVADRVASSDALDPALERLAISCGLAQSIKLGAFESAMRLTIENTRHLPEELARSGEITASRREVACLMGQLFLDRYRYHLSGDLLMTPAFFWDNEQYLPFYRRVERYLEVRERGEVLNTRVEVVQELYKLLGEEVNHRNSAALELAITVMIAFEILLTLLTLARESIQSMFSACALFFILSAAGWTAWLVYRRLRISRLVRDPGRRRSTLYKST